MDENSGSPTEAKTYRDIEAVCTWARANVLREGEDGSGRNKVRSCLQRSRPSRGFHTCIQRLFDESFEMGCDDALLPTPGRKIELLLVCLRYYLHVTTIVDDVYSVDSPENSGEYTTWRRRTSMLNTPIPMHCWRGRVACEYTTSPKR